MNHGYQFPVQSDFQGHAMEHFIEVGKLESISISLAPRFYYFLWSEFSNTADKSMLKWKYENACKNKKEEVSWLSRILYPPCPCLPASHLLWKDYLCTPTSKWPNKAPKSQGKITLRFLSLISFTNFSYLSFADSSHSNKILLIFINIFLYVLWWACIIFIIK